MLNKESAIFDFYRNQVLDCEDDIDTACVGVAIAQAHLQGDLSKDEAIDLLLMLQSVEEEFFNNRSSGE